MRAVLLAAGAFVAGWLAKGGLSAEKEAVPRQAVDEPFDVLPTDDAYPEVSGGGVPFAYDDVEVRLPSGRTLKYYMDQLEADGRLPGVCKRPAVAGEIMGTPCPDCGYSNVLHPRRRL